MKRFLFTLPLLFVLGAGCGWAKTPQSAAPPAPPPAVPASASVPPQTTPPSSDEPDAILVSNNKVGNEVEVDYVKIAKQGFVVIHEDKDGQPGGVAGVSPLLNAGEQREVFVKKIKIKDKTSYWAMLHYDDGDGQFDAQKDPPVKNANGGIVMGTFEGEY
jgi:hypothetical protein